MFGNDDGIRFGGGPGAGTDKPAGLHDSIQRASINHQIFDDRESADAEWLDCDCGAVTKFSHVKLADRAGMIRTMGLTIDRKRTGSADAFAAIGIESDRLLIAREQLFV